MFIIHLIIMEVLINYYIIPISIQTHFFILCLGFQKDARTKVTFN
jgi:hypothetical protein